MSDDALAELWITEKFTIDGWTVSGRERIGNSLANTN